MIKKNSNEAKLIDEALKQYAYFLEEKTKHRLYMLIESNMIDVENVANEHNEKIIDIELLRKKLLDTPDNLE